MFENVQKFVRKRKKVNNFIYARGKKVDNCLYAREKKVDFREMLYAQKIVFSNLDLITYFRQSLGLCLNDNILTNLGPISVDLIFYAPNGAYLGFWRIEPKIAF